MKGSIIIVSFFVAGVLLGRLVDVPALLAAEEPTLYALYVLMFLVGISIGSDKKALEALKHQNFKIILVPLATIIGTLVGLGFNQPRSKRQKPHRLSRSRLRIRILFPFDYFYHSIQRCRTRHNCLSI